ncbi:PREDICTED: uncharacterized protein LOC108965321 [Bactrocera latifrons]|uniref:uncharacterized protein LOC108965321 n=1 Tax=Bactrocera latifrons TaxID=174628 RepID=UPI0008DE5CCD|nr:PREDICTED: uncharacterized protein LOC108965321 [Bactrocera latifrons]
MADLPKSDKKWTHERKKLLITVRLSHESDFATKTKKRSTIWQKIRRDILKKDKAFPFSLDEIMRCYTNLLGTYKRIKRRSATSGKAATNWEFFEEMDDVYGTRCSVVAPENMVRRSLEPTGNENSSSSPSPCPSPSASSEVTHTIRTRKRKRNEVISFLTSESEKQEKLFEALVATEKEKVKIEKEKLMELKSIRKLYERILERNIDII